MLTGFVDGSPEAATQVAGALDVFRSALRLDPRLAPVKVAVLSDDPDMTAGDFVRWCKQVVDLLGQVALVAEDLSPRGAELRRTTRKAVEAVRRGVVAYSSVV